MNDDAILNHVYYSPRSETRLRMRTSTDNVEVSATTSLRGTKIFSTRPRRTRSLSETHWGASAMEKERPHPRQPNPLRTHHCGERTSSHFLLSMEPAKDQCCMLRGDRGRLREYWIPPFPYNLRSRLKNFCTTLLLSMSPYGHLDV